MTNLTIKPRTHNYQDLKGMKFGRLLILERTGSNHAICQCDCGAEKSIRVNHLLSGATKSCGCLRSNSPNLYSTHNATSGGKPTPEYKSWIEMKNRTSNPECNRFARYGARGITVCDRWLHSFENFLADMGERPSLKHSIDRKDNDGNYEPSNCKWSTPKEQANNRSTNKYLTYNGETLTIAEWSEKIGLKYHTIISRIGEGLPIDKILNPFVVKRNRIYGKKTNV